MTRDIKEILKTYWGYDDFRSLQEEIIRSVLDGKDTLALMPTGGGKSLTYQVSGLAMEGVCLVVTPLIALMKDQVEDLKNRQIPAEAIYTGMRRDGWSRSLINVYMIRLSSCTCRRAIVLGTVPGKIEVDERVSDYRGRSSLYFSMGV